MQLDARKRRILQAIIDEYIDTAEPVGSRYIARKHEWGLSSATIRNEMADLEDMGYLAQPHTSAGRVPSDKGYRLYVDDLMEVRDPTLEEVRALTGEMDVKINELGELIKTAAAAISRLTRYTTVTVTRQRRSDSEIQAVQLVGIEGGRVCVVLISRSGAVSSGVAAPSARLDAAGLVRATKVLEEGLNGHTPEGIRLGEAQDMSERLRAAGVAESAIRPVLEAVAECVRKMETSELFLEGAANIFDFPEFRDIERARELLQILEEKKSIEGLIRELAAKAGEHTRVLIGAENPIEEIKDCSIVSAAYGAGNMAFGTIGVIGPKRMDYSRVVSMVEYINKVIVGEIEKLAGEADED